MKFRTTFKLVLICTFLFGSYATSQTFTYANTLTPKKLVEDVLIGTGVVASNITFNGTTAAANTIQTSAETFSVTGGTPAFPFPSGVYLQTNTAATITDPDLSAIASLNPTNGAILEFDFVATGDSLVFNYIFGSVEYSGFTCSGYNDAFGFFLSGPGIAGPYTNNAVNIALVPGTNIPVTINTVNSGVPSAGNATPCSNADPNWQANSVYFTTTYGNFGEGFTGSTVQMTALSGLQCGGTYHIKLAVCNVGDTGLDSGVFLKANSFSSNAVTIQAEASVFSGSFTDTILAEGCTSTDLLFIRPTSDSVQTFSVTYSGTASATGDFNNLNGSVTFPIGVDTMVFNITPVNDGITEPMEWIQIKGYTVTVCGDTLYDSLTLYIVDQYDLTFDMADTVTVGCMPSNAPINISNYANSIPNYSLVWDFGSTANPTLIPSTSNQQDTIMHYVTVTDGCGVDFVDSVAVIHNVVPPDIEILPNDTLYIKCIPNSVTATVNLTAPVNPNFPYNYVWSDGSTGTSITLSDNGVNGEEIPFSVTVTDGCTNTSTVNGVLIVDQSLTIDNMPMTPSNFCNSTGEISANISGQTTDAAPLSYAWSGPGAGSTNTFTGQTWTNLNPGWYYLTVTDDHCTASDSVYVSKLAAPVAQVSATPSSGVAPVTVTFTNTSQNAQTYYWDFGDGLTSTTNDLSSQTVTFNEEGVYTVTLIASQGGGCNDTAYVTITVTILYPPVIEVPNVFTPNGDQSNDFWSITSTNTAKIDLVITNRWGNVMFEETGLNPVWDGKTKGGTPAKDGVYFYKFVVYGTDGSETPGQGYIHITE